ncbi:MAG: DsbA family protein [Gemmatimonadota bacterium]
MGIAVYLYGDYACPHTYVMDARLELLASEGVLAAVWRPLPTNIEGSEANWHSLGDPGPDFDANIQDLRRASAALGLPFDLPARRPSTRRALLSSEFARDCGPANFLRFHRAVFRAVFSDAADIGDPEVLAGLAGRSGIDIVGLEAALEDRRYESALNEVEAEAARYGIDATPTVLIGKYKLVGAAPLEVLRSTVTRAAASASA